MAALLIAVFAANAVWSLRGKSVTVDEYLYIAEGYHYLQTSEYLPVEFPPLAPLLAGAALLGADLRLPERGDDRLAFADEFVFSNRLDSDALVLRARLPTVALGMLLGLAVFSLARRLYGRAAGAMALALYTTSPNILAHTRLATTDLPLTCFVFLAVYAGYRYTETRHTAWLVLAGTGFGLGLASKFSALLLVPIAIVSGAAMAYGRWNASTPGGTAGNTVGTRAARASFELVAVLGIALVVLMLAYGGRHIGSFLNGILVQISHNQAGHAAYLMGDHAQTGWISYFPIAFAIKTPLGLFGLLGLAVWRLRRAPAAHRRAAVVLLVPVGVFMLAGMASQINIGLRYVLPIYPFLFVFAGSAIHAIPALAGRAVCVALVGWFAMSGIQASPDYLAYFNEVVGGRDNGPEYLLDSNIAWGQDVKPLTTYLRERRIEEVKLAVFRGCRNVPDLRCEPLTCEPTTGTLAISVNALYGLTQSESRCYAWLRESDPVARIGGSIYVYDIDARAPAGTGAAPE